MQRVVDGSSENATLIFAPFGLTTGYGTRTCIVTYSRAASADLTEMRCSVFPVWQRRCPCDSWHIACCYNGFSKAAVFSYDCLMLIHAWMCGPTQQLRKAMHTGNQRICGWVKMKRYRRRQAKRRCYTGPLLQSCRPGSFYMNQVSSW